jgi:TonB family protein
MQGAFAVAMIGAVLLGSHAFAGPQQGALTFDSPGVAHVGDRGLTLPVVVKRVGIRYTAEAMRAGVHGPIIVECIVKTDGTIGDVRIVRAPQEPLGMDDEAIKTAKQWRFKPGRKDGKPVPVLVSIDFQFSTRSLM